MYILCISIAFLRSFQNIIDFRFAYGSRISASLAQFQVAGSGQVIARADAAGDDQKIQIQVERGAILEIFGVWWIFGEKKWQLGRLGQNWRI